MRTSSNSLTVDYRVPLWQMLVLHNVVLCNIRELYDNAKENTRCLVKLVMYIRSLVNKQVMYNSCYTSLVLKQVMDNKQVMYISCYPSLVSLYTAC